MLTHLSIHNIALIEQLSVSFRASSGPNLCVLTGETGAGKSIILDALGFVLGNKPAPYLLRSGCNTGTVTAEFSRPSNPETLSHLETYGIVLDEQVIFRRSLSKDGKSRAYINDIPISLAGLKAVAASFVEIHGQHEQQGLLDPDTHLSILDAYGSLTALRQEVSVLFTDWQQKRRAFEKEQQQVEASRKEEEYLHHTVAELDALAPQPGEETILTEKRSRGMHTEKLVATLTQSLAALGESGVHARLCDISRTLSKQVSLVEEAALDPALQCLERALIEIDEADRQLDTLLSHIHSQAESIDQVEERLFALRAAARKFRCTVDALPELQATMQQQLQALQQAESTLQARLGEAEQAQSAYLEKAQSLSHARKTAATHFEQALMAELTPLKMEKTRFAVTFNPPEAPVMHADGIDEICFKASTNPSTPLSSLSAIASGGELSRFMVAMKCILTHIHGVPTIIFDEVDTGIGGATADAVGKRLLALSHHAQVIVVTHQPQVAALASQHLLVTKQHVHTLAREGDGHEEQTQVHVTSLSDAHRQEEIARMLAGAEITEEARAAALKLMYQQAATYA